MAKIDSNDTTRDAAAKAMRTAGVSVDKIAKAIGTSKSTAFKISDPSYERKPVGRPATARVRRELDRLVRDRKSARRTEQREMDLEGEALEKWRDFLERQKKDGADDALTNAPVYKSREVADASDDPEQANIDAQEEWLRGHAAE